MLNRWTYLNTEPKKHLSRRKVFVIVWLLIIALLLVGIIISGTPIAHTESIKEVMRDGVLHDVNKISIFGLLVNPAVISAYIVTALLIVAAVFVRIFAIPRFKRVPSKFQSVIEWTVGFFADMADKNSSHKPRFIGAYIFSVGAYIFFGTLFELLGVQFPAATSGTMVLLPAPLADINAAIAMGFTSYFVILFAGIIRGPRKTLGVLKDFSLPISMSFRLFGALLSGLLVNELVYYYFALSFVVPVIVGVLFTLLHALIQTYVLATLVSIFYGEAVEPGPHKNKIKKEGKQV